MLRDELSALIGTVLELQITKETKLNFLRDYLLWKWTCGLRDKTKLRNCPFWSEKAFKQWLPTGRVQGLRHEHVVPRNVLAKMLLERFHTGRATIATTLDTFCHGCVLTRDEDKEFGACGLKSVMPKDWDGIDIWARYKHAFRKTGITVLKLAWPEATIVTPVFTVAAPGRQKLMGDMVRRGAMPRSP